jgi:hypothetical protein
MAATGVLVGSGSVIAGNVARIGTGLSIKYWDGADWQIKTLKHWGGVSWQTKTLKRWNGSAWV